MEHASGAQGAAALQDRLKHLSTVLDDDELFQEVGDVQHLASIKCMNIDVLCTPALHKFYACTGHAQRHSTSSCMAAAAHSYRLALRMSIQSVAMRPRPSTLLSYLHAGG